MKVKMLKDTAGRKLDTVVDVYDGLAEDWILHGNAVPVNQMSETMEASLKQRMDKMRVRDAEQAKVTRHFAGAPMKKVASAKADNKGGKK